MAQIQNIPPVKEKNYTGEYQARVEDVKDLTGQMRVRVRVFGVFGDNVPIEDLPFAEYRLPVGSRLNEGFFTPCQVGDLVWVDFPFGGDTRRPRITGGIHYCPEKKPYLPEEVWGGEDSIEHKRGNKIPKPSDPVVTKHNSFQQNGVLIEIAEGGVLRATQLATGTAIEITEGGRILMYSSVDLQINVKSNASIETEGNTKVITHGDTKIQTTGKTDINSGQDINVMCGGSANVKATGGINLDGGSGSVKGIVQGDCICAITGKPHPHISFTVKGSK